jgi:antagonist of KipI
VIVRVNKAGMLTTVQDRGRWGYQAMGVSVAGPMDGYSHRLANLLVGNTDDAATLEVTLTGPELEFADDRAVAIVGAEFEAASNAVVHVRAGQRLTFGRRIRGARAYVAISGGIVTPKILGSRATHLPSAMGGVDGRALKAGDELPLGPVGPPEGGHYRTDFRNDSGRNDFGRNDSGRNDFGRNDSGRNGFGRNDFGRNDFGSVRLQADHSPTLIRVLPGPQLDRFAAGALDALQSAAYRIGTDSNRMGYRLQGPRLEHAHGADIISDATPIGSLQVPASGQPILLMADRQTTGGYAKIATVISADISLAGQLAPGDELRFAVCSQADALTALMAQEQTLLAIAGRA